MKRATPKAGEYLQLLQMEIAKRAGTDAFVHSVRRIVQNFGKILAYVMLTLDLRNAFHLCSRAAFLEVNWNLDLEFLP